MQFLNYKTGSFFLLTFIIFTISSCKKTEPKIPEEEEVITTLTYTLTDDSTGNTVVFNFQDLDGDGGIDPIKTSGSLVANSSYSGALFLQNEAEDSTIDISAEVLDEATDHQFFYHSHMANVSIDYNDSDANGKPIGLQTKVTTGDASTGHLTITLRHQPDKTATDVEAGDVTNAGGETDIEVQFDVVIE